MATPTITAVSPNRIYTGGQLITITGTGFQTRYPIDPATPHPWPMPAPTVSISVDGRSASKVVVASSTSLSCLAASHDPGPATIVLQNLASNGEPIAGESATATGLLSFARVDLALKADMLRLVESLVTELRRQVIENVSVTTSVDYDGNPNHLAGVDLAALPALCLTGPSNPTRNRLYNTVPRFERVEADGQISRRTTFETQDLGFQLLGLDNSGVRSLNLQALVTQFFKTNNYLTVLRDPSNLVLGSVAYELEGGPFASTSVSNDNNLRAFSGPVVVKGYQFEDVAGFPDQLIAAKSPAVDDFNVARGSFTPIP